MKMDRAKAKAAAEKLVAKMTLEEKASQLRYDAPAIERLHIPAYNWWNEALHGVARAGTATVFPQAIGLAERMETGIFIKELRSGRRMSIFSGIPAGAGDMRPTARTRS